MSDILTNNKLQDIILIYNPQRILSSYILGMLVPILIIPGLSFILQGEYVGFIAIMVWLSLFTLRTGATIDFERKILNSFFELFWIKFYRVKNLDNYTELRIKTVSESYRFYSKIQSKQFDKEFQSIELFDMKTNRYEQIAWGDKEKILAIAEKIGKYFGIPRIKKLSHINKQIT